MNDHSGSSSGINTQQYYCVTVTFIFSCSRYKIDASEIYALMVTHIFMTGSHTNSPLELYNIVWKQRFYHLAYHFRNMSTCSNQLVVISTTDISQLFHTRTFMEIRKLRNETRQRQSILTPYSELPNKKIWMSHCNMLIIERINLKPVAEVFPFPKHCM